MSNIYAQEALFRVRVRPTRPAGRVPRAALAAVVGAIRTILDEAIAAGGSTISDFHHAGGEAGWFQHSFQVYGRETLPCVTCKRPLRLDVIAGRSTVWCRTCQT
jgi:formamidopyrimidine-DNA glycosylase